MAEWSWEPEDFAALWLGDARDRLPSPLSYTSSLPTQDDVRRHRQQVHGRYDADERDLIEVAFRTLTDAELRIQIHGQSRALGNGKTRDYRILGARTRFNAMMLTQTADPGQDGVDGTVRCRLFRTEQLAPRLANIVPSFPPGKEKPDTFHFEDIRRPAQGFSRNTPRDRYDRLSKRPVDGGGTAALFTGSVFHTLNPWYAVQWVDVGRDGRYLQQRTREHLTIRPASPQDLTTTFQTWIERALERLREDEPDTW
ncbi:ESX secretion-associated protein EspG [Nocardia macrotermitis]|uniref:ESX secretion-associated protein EspG n=1 Tax=Nocardia macrotermitis TaxID=2585198 RepID=A0A7K0D3I7_9NOCA|nr:ESX secretion-associated protein EspG [Nocardia macrotermitis]MQY19494.1 hypothetical protein [Nocardia macrotermitis]